MILTRTEVKILCAERKACKVVMAEMSDLGFTDIEEKTDKVDADIIAKLDYKDEGDLNRKFTELFARTGEKIDQVSFKQ